MVGTYIRLAFRNLLINKTSTAIHSIGLSVGIVSALMTLFYVDFEKSYEDMHARRPEFGGNLATFPLYHSPTFLLLNFQSVIPDKPFQYFNLPIYPPCGKTI